jgi:hypothetical protein
MVAENGVVIRLSRRYLSYDDAVAVARQARCGGGRGAVVLLLPETADTTTAALARLVVLRQELLRAGRDLCVSGLVGRAERLYGICRLNRLLPRCAPDGAGPGPGQFVPQRGARRLPD